MEGTEHLDLKNRHHSFTWNITTTFGNNAAVWQTAEISDQINDLLAIEKVELVDSQGTDVLKNGTLTTDNNLVKVVFTKKDDSFGYLSGQTYTLKITTKIGKAVTASQLEPFIKGNGIPNQAELTFGHTPGKIVSEIPTVTPPELSPLPETGGSGRILYLVAGIFSALLAGFYLSYRYRKEVA